MPPRIPGLSLGLRGRTLLAPPRRNVTASCLVCSFKTPATSTSALSGKPRRPRRNRSLDPASQRAASTDADPSPPSPQPRSPDPRTGLVLALRDLGNHAPSHVNMLRLKLALRSLADEAGRGALRVAVLGARREGLAGSAGGDSARTTATAAAAAATRSARELVRLALADPLSPPADWERKLQEHDPSQPLVVRASGSASGGTGEDASEVGEEQQRVRIMTPSRTDGVLPELVVTTPLLRGEVKLEILVMEASLPKPEGRLLHPGAMEEAFLVPTVEVLAPGASRHTPITTPVHRTLLVGEGIMGAASLMSLPGLAPTVGSIAGAVHLQRELLLVSTHEQLPFFAFDTAPAAEGLDLIRASVANAMQYEHLWSESNVAAVRDWLLAGSSPIPSDPEEEGQAAAPLRLPVRDLIVSLLRNARASIQAEEARQRARLESAKVNPTTAADLEAALARWAQGAHDELQAGMDRAFSGREWQALGWWRLFWSADDVGMLAAEMLNQRFLHRAEDSAVFLAGRWTQAGMQIRSAGEDHASNDGDASRTEGPSTAEKHINDKATGSSNLKPDHTALALANTTTSTTSTTSAPNPPWPTSIPSARVHLVDKTVPALQALAQRLVLQASSTAGLTAALAALSYLSGFGAYECGAIAAAGMAWSLRRLQRRWDAARDFWEDDVCEHGRRAVKATEARLAARLDRALIGEGGEGGDADADADASIERAEAAPTSLLRRLMEAGERVKRAEEALDRVR